MYNFFRKLGKINIYVFDRAGRDEDNFWKKMAWLAICFSIIIMISIIKYFNNEEALLIAFPVIGWYLIPQFYFWWIYTPNMRKYPIDNSSDSEDLDN